MEAASGKHAKDGQWTSSKERDFIGFKPGFNPLRKADLMQAELHRECRRVRNLRQLQVTPHLRQCDCCGLPLDAPMFSLCTSVMSLSELGPGFPQYYWFVKYLFAALLLTFAIAGLPALISDYLANHYEDWDSEPQWAIISSTGNRGHPSLRSSVLPLWQSILHIIAMVCLLLSYYYASAWMQRQEVKIDELNTTPADFTVWFEGLGAHFDRKKLKSFLEQRGRSDGQPATVVKINVPITITEFIAAARRKHYLQSRLTYLEMYSEENGERPTTSCCMCCRKRVPPRRKLESDLESVSRSLHQIEARYESGRIDHMGIGQAFVTFATQTDAARVIENFKGNAVGRFLRRLCGMGSFASYLFEKKLLKGRRAPEPSDIIWENLGCGTFNRFLHRLLTTLITLVTLCVCFGMVYGCTVYRKNIYDYYQATEQKSFVDLSRGRMASILPALGVIAINFVLARAIRRFSAYEKTATLTNYNSSVAVKLTIAQCVNTALIAILVSRDWQDWFKPFGLVVDMHYIFISNTVVGAMVNLVSPMYMLRSLRRCIRRRNKFLVQGEANALYEGPPVDMAQRYANVVKTLIVVLAYAPIMPLGLLFGMGTMVLDYWVDKALLLRRHCRPMRMSGDMSKMMFRFVPWSVLIYSIMNYIFILKLNEDDSAPALIWMIICICLVALPVKALLRHCCCCFGCFRKERKSVNGAAKTYAEEAVNFIDDYDRANPVTQREGWEAYLSLVAERSLISSLAQTQLLQSIANSGVASFLQNYAGSRMSLRQYQAQFEPSQGNAFLAVPTDTNIMSLLRVYITQQHSAPYHTYGIPQNAGISALAYYASGGLHDLQMVDGSIRALAKQNQTESVASLYPNLDQD